MKFDAFFLFCFFNAVSCLVNSLSTCLTFTGPVHTQYAPTVCETQVECCQYAASPRVSWEAAL